MGLSGGGGGASQQLPVQTMARVGMQQPQQGINLLPQQGVQWGGPQMGQQGIVAGDDPTGLMRHPGDIFRNALFDGQAPKNMRDFLIQQLLSGNR